MEKIIDTHSHLFEPEFAGDLPEVIARAVDAGVSHICLPNIDASSIEAMLQVCADYPTLCYPMIGLHPTSVKEDYRQELEEVHRWLSEPNHPFIAIGEVGLDLYWDRTYQKEQIEAFRQQIEWAITYKLPLVIHSRDAFEQLYSVLSDYRNSSLHGVFHSFTGNEEEARKLLTFDGFMLGVNGVLTFKKSTLPQSLLSVPLERVVLETDSPYLAPAPNRGKRNETSYIRYTLSRLAEVYHTSEDAVALITSKNAIEVFNLREKVVE